MIHQIRLIGRDHLRRLPLTAGTSGFSPVPSFPFLFHHSFRLILPVFIRNFPVPDQVKVIAVVFRPFHFIQIEDFRQHIRGNPALRFPHVLTVPSFDLVIDPVIDRGIRRIIEFQHQVGIILPQPEHFRRMIEHDMVDFMTDDINNLF